MHIALCDGCAPDRERAARQLRRYFAARGLPCHLRCFSSSGEPLCSVEGGMWYDGVILDGCLSPLPGIDAARELRQLGYAGVIVFLCARSDFAVAGYEVGAAGYLLKPLRYDKLRACLDRSLRVESEQTYEVRRRGKVQRIPYGEITHVESRNSNCLVHLRGGESFVVYKKLGDIEGELDDRRFLRCHQSYLVNMDYICRADRQFELTTGEVVLIRQHGLGAIRRHYLSYRAAQGEE